MGRSGSLTRAKDSYGSLANAGRTKDRAKESQRREKDSAKESQRRAAAPSSASKAALETSPTSKTAASTQRAITKFVKELKVYDVLQYLRDLLRCSREANLFKKLATEKRDYVFRLLYEVWPKQSDTDVTGEIAKPFSGRRELRCMLLLACCRTVILHFTAITMRQITRYVYSGGRPLTAAGNENHNALTLLVARGLSGLVAKLGRVFPALAAQNSGQQSGSSLGFSLFATGLLLTAASATQSALSKYMLQKLQVIFRDKLTSKLHNLYFENRRYYHLTNTQAPQHTVASPQEIITREVASISGRLAQMLNLLTTALPTIAWFTVYVFWSSRGSHGIAPGGPGPSSGSSRAGFLQKIFAMTRSLPTKLALSLLPHAYLLCAYEVAQRFFPKNIGILHRNNAAAVAQFRSAASRVNNNAEAIASAIVPKSAAAAGSEDSEDSEDQEESDDEQIEFEQNTNNNSRQEEHSSGRDAGQICGSHREQEILSQKYKGVYEAESALSEGIRKFGLTFKLAYT